MFSKQRKQLDDLGVNENISYIKIGNPIESEFMKGFIHSGNDNEIDFSTYKTQEIDLENYMQSPKPMEMNYENRKKLSESIVISLDIPVSRNDLEFVGNSHVDGKPIYRYTGINFSTFNLPYDEVASIERYISKLKRDDLAPSLNNYVKYVDKAIDNSYSNYYTLNE